VVYNGNISCFFSNKTYIYRKNRVNYAVFVGKTPKFVISKKQQKARKKGSNRQQNPPFHGVYSNLFKYYIINLYSLYKIIQNNLVKIGCFANCKLVNIVIE